MRTSKPFSTVTYNTIPYLTDTLNELVRTHNVAFWAFIKHRAEDDETKEHIHLLVIPNRIIDTMAFTDLFNEFDPANPDKPLRCLPCKSSKIDDWILYAVHDTNYLASKGQVRRFHYRFDEVVNSDNDYFVELTHEIDYAPFRRFETLRDMAKSGVPFCDVAAQGIIPLHLFNQYKSAYECIQSGTMLYRAARKGHEDEQADDYYVDYDSGEIRPLRYSNDDGLNNRG